MGVKVSGGSSVIQKTPFATEAAIAVTTSVWTTALSIAGRGELDMAIAKSTASTICKLRITLDSVLVHSSVASASAGVYTGISQVGNNTVFTGSTPKSYPYTASVTGTHVILAQTLPFKTSCLVEVFLGTTETCNATVSGSTY